MTVSSDFARRALRGAGLAVALGFAGAPAVAVHAADTAATAKSDATPDFMQGRKMWVLAGGPNYNPVPGSKLPGPVAGTGKYRPKITDPVAITDNPLLQPWAKKVMDAANQKTISGIIPFNAASRCYPGGVPGILLFPGEPMEIVQTPKEVWLMWKRDAQIQRVYLNVPHSKNPPYSWYGESVGHYENGDTLVVDTIGLDDKGPIDRFRTPHTKQLHVIERFKLTNGGKRFEVLVHVEDPGTFTSAWEGLIKFEQGYEYRNDHWEEDICAEAGDGLIPVPGAVPIPHATRRDF
ncbi:MAG: hypothetical protein KGO48_17330 [Alphaproteobacteria bacterium]|nr:hypothetical protein [Alphaproteobacteria bacterium]